ncbi:MAG: EAL domain-containing protein [Campylobacterota bacterium]|nr:EAL domain-containing protein [Campylobacterota bacterium]
MAFSLEDLKENNSALLNLLTRHLPDMLWVKDINGIYMYVNQAICDGLLMAKDTNEPIGKGDLFFAMRERELHKDKPDWHTFGELCFNSDIDVIEQNRAMKFEEYGNVKGELMYLEVYKAPFYDKEGNIIGTVGAGRDITQLKKIQANLENSLKILDEQREQLEYQASYDLLTNLPNRALFVDRLQESIKRAKRDHGSVVILFIDLDNFKEINDSLGHDVGDKILIQFANRVKGKIRNSDTFSRFGGDEFCIILNDIENNESIVDFITKIMKMTQEAFLVSKRKFYIGMSIGVSIYPNDGEDVSTLLKNSDVAMYKAKENGKSRYCFYDEEMTKMALERVSLEAELRKALEEDEFVVYFQPQVNAVENRLLGMEALVRWQHPTHGLISPDKFLPLAERTGLIIDIDRVVMRKSILQFNEWYKNGLNPGKLALNLGAKQIEADDFVDFVEKLLDEKGYECSNLEFEVTESQVMKDPEQSAAILKELRKLGLSIAIDDFGTGYSSFAYLKRLPIQKLKIDKSFIDDLPDDSEDIAITKTIISLCENLNLKVIAEGVENEQQRDFLVESGCKFIQGYLYSAPMSIESMTKYLEETIQG